MSKLNLLTLLIALMPSIAITAPADSLRISIGASGTETVWEAANVMGKVCIDSQGATVDYWFIKNGRNYKTRTADQEVCLNVDPKLIQQLRVRNKEAYEIVVLAWDDVSGLGVLLAPLVSLEELGKAIGDGLADFEKSLRQGLEKTFKINVHKGQKGLGCYLVFQEPQVGTSKGINWVSWRTDQAVTPTTKKGRNMKLRGFELKLQEDGKYFLTSDSFANTSKHSNWDSSLIVKPGILNNEKFEEVGQPFEIKLGKLRHGKSNMRNDTGSFSVTPAEYKKLDSEEGRIFVCLRTNRYG